MVNYSVENKQKEIYEAPEMQIYKFETEDIMIDSLFDNGGVELN